MMYFEENKQSCIKELTILLTPTCRLLSAKVSLSDELFQFLDLTYVKNNLLICDELFQPFT